MSKVRIIVLIISIGFSIYFGISMVNSINEAMEAEKQARIAEEELAAAEKEVREAERKLQQALRGNFILAS